MSLSILILVSYSYRIRVYTHVCVCFDIRVHPHTCIEYKQQLSIPLLILTMYTTKQNKTAYINVPRNFLIHILFKTLSLSLSLKDRVHAWCGLQSTARESESQVCPGPESARAYQPMCEHHVSGQSKTSIDHCFFE